jgi:hypothetical protein
LAASESADDADLLPPEPENYYASEAWYHHDYADDPHQWPPDCNQCPVAACWEVPGGEACIKAIRRQHRLDLAPVDDEMVAYWELMDKCDVPDKWPPDCNLCSDIDCMDEPGQRRCIANLRQQERQEAIP